MSEYTILHDISKTLLELLKANMDDLITQGHISLDSPADVVADTAPRLSLFLYQIEENQFLKNQDMKPVNNGKLSYPPLALNLFYLFTAYAQTRETEQQVIGKTMQVLYANSVVRGSLLQGTLSATFEELKIMFYPLSIDDMNKLWSMFGSKAYKLSVTYKVSAALIDSTREVAGDRVIKRTLNHYIQQ